MPTVQRADDLSTLLRKALHEVARRHYNDGGLPFNPDTAACYCAYIECTPKEMVLGFKLGDAKFVGQWVAEAMQGSASDTLSKIDALLEEE